jgi:hypothetical protein
MQVHDDLKALSRDAAAWEQGQRTLARTIAAWRTAPEAASVLAALDRFGRKDPLDSCAALAALFAKVGDDAPDPAPDTPSDPARELVSGLMRRGLAALAAHPLGQMPFRHAHRQAADTLLLAHSGTATLGLAEFDGAALARQPAPRTAEFAPVETWFRVLAGSGRGDLTTRDPKSAALRTEALDLVPGMTFHRHGARQALQLREVSGSLVVLRLQRLTSLHDPVREVALGDGDLRSQAALTAEYSRMDMAMAALAALGRQDAVPALSRLVHGQGPAALRWQALRAILALDTRAGLVLLRTVASSDDPALSGPARDLHRTLVAQWPELEKVAQWRG